MFFLLVGISALAWATYSVVTGKVYYVWVPPEGYDRDARPFGFWAPTVILYICGAYLVLLGLGVVR